MEVKAVGRDTFETEVEARGNRRRVVAARCSGGMLDAALLGHELDLPS